MTTGPAVPTATRVETGLSSEPLRVDDLLDAVRGPSVGGIGVFIGVVRDVDGHDGADRTVRSLDYTAHPSAADRLRQVADEVAAHQADASRPVDAIAVRHRTGHLEIGDLAVVVAVGARHRGPALDACRLLIDRIKVEVPVWKEQRFADGDVEWVGL